MTEVKACDAEEILPKRFHAILKQSEELRTIYEEAMERGTDTLVDMLTDPEALMDLCQNDVNLVKVLSNNLMWVASRRVRRKYGDKVEIDHTLTVTADKAITAALDAGLERARGIRRDSEDAAILDEPNLLLGKSDLDEAELDIDVAELLKE